MNSGRDRGAAAVEMAFLLPLLLLVLFGILDFGLLLKAQIGVTEAAREGARAATVDTRGGAAAARVAQVDSAYSTSVVSACGADPSPGDTAVITVTYRYDWATPVGALAGIFGGGGYGTGLTVRGTGVMPCRA
ncbi:TadE/TadG family type IV pilus assembly protein [Catellatospora sp. KI3]|uniref:TadE/TadG family type IV pilus assembly protein n=1 Tax=Catellatospora sp. KI3 TaxID=3041620 RepID=UPI002482CC05|nr:TadE/TadG family type IV pilus assembly protein [Catellatospora sp. KI3]MDI1461705.1 TadE/TadG family type IV pilus assembly protein [Catellatospora sp. KI3]